MKKGLRMTGTLPVAAWRNLSSLSYLTLAFNNFSSSVPASLASALPSLRTLFIDYNCLTGVATISAVKRKRDECLIPRQYLHTHVLHLVT